MFYSGTGAPVIVLHEIFGLAPECVALADKLVAEPFTVFMPLLFGEPSKAHKGIGGVKRACINREFKCLAANESSPITVWLRALAADVSRRCSGRKVGAIGMCLTGGFVLSMMIDTSVAAPVACQPSLLLTGAGPLGFNKGALGISQENLAAAKRQHQNGTPLMGVQFETDSICPKQRMDRLQEEFPNMKRIEIPATEKKHCTLAVNFDPRAYDEVVKYLHDHLPAA